MKNKQHTQMMRRINCYTFVADAALCFPQAGFKLLPEIAHP
jgi:hypothetical protein